MAFHHQEGPSAHWGPTPSLLSPCQGVRGGVHWLCFQFCRPTVCKSRLSALYNNTVSLDTFGWWQKTSFQAVLNTIWSCCGISATLAPSTHVPTYLLVWYRKLCSLIVHHYKHCMCCVSRLRISDWLFRLQKVLEFLVHWYVFSLLTILVDSLFPSHMGSYDG